MIVVALYAQHKSCISVYWLARQCTRQDIYAAQWSASSLTSCVTLFRSHGKQQKRKRTISTDENTPLLSAGDQTNMAEKIGISQQTLVSNGGQIGRAKRLPQYLAGIAVTLGAVAAGMVLGWTSPAGENGTNLQKDYKISINRTEFSWISSLVPLGAGVICIPIGILADWIGRKTTLLLIVIPFTIGWLLIIFANSLVMFYFGRFITGFSAGAFCVGAPLYTSEIAESEIRGTLGSYFQLMLTVGILLSYIFGATIKNMVILSSVSAIMPVIFFVVFFFMPETPIYYLKKGNDDAARKSLVKLRGHQYDVDVELQQHRAALEETSRHNVSFFDAFQSRATRKGFLIAYGLMLFQQMSGVNAIIFYASNIFKEANALEPDEATIIVGAVQVVSVFAGSLVVDKLGRRLLLLSSIVVMFLMTLILGVYFYCTVHNDIFNDVKWFAIIPVCIFLMLFSVGFGPIPWMMMPEIFAPEIKGIAGSSACLFNWLMAFVVTKFYPDLVETAIRSYGTFWIFSGFCAIGIIFVYFLVPETKGKTLEQIQRELND